MHTYLQMYTFCQFNRKLYTFCLLTTVFTEICQKTWMTHCRQCCHTNIPQFKISLNSSTITKIFCYLYWNVLCHYITKISTTTHVKDRIQCIKFVMYVIRHESPVTPKMNDVHHTAYGSEVVKKKNAIINIKTTLYKFVFNNNRAGEGFWIQHTASGNDDQWDWSVHAVARHGNLHSWLGRYVYFRLIWSSSSVEDLYFILILCYLAYFW